MSMRFKVVKPSHTFVRQTLCKDSYATTLVYLMQACFVITEMTGLPTERSIMPESIF